MLPVLFAPFSVLVLLDGGAVAVLVCDRVLRADTLAPTVGLKAARLLRYLNLFVN